MQYKFLFCLACMLSVVSVCAAAPFLTEDASTLEKDQVIFKSKVIFEKFTKIRNPLLFDEDLPEELTGIDVERDVWLVPVEIRAGLAQNFTLCLSAFYMYEALAATAWGKPGVSDGLYSLSASGFSRIAVKGLYRLVKEEGGIPGISVLVGTSFPLGDEDYCAEDGQLKLRVPLGQRGVSISLWEAISKRFDSVRLHLNLGYELCLPYTQKLDSQGNVLSVVRSIDPGDRAVYNIAMEKDFKALCFVAELNGYVARDAKQNTVNISGSGRHVLQALLGLEFRPAAKTDLQIGFLGTLLSSGGNRDYYYGPVLGLNQRF